MEELYYRVNFETHIGTLVYSARRPDGRPWQKASRETLTLKCNPAAKMKLGAVLRYHDRVLDVSRKLQTVPTALEVCDCLGRAKEEQRIAQLHRPNRLPTPTLRSVPVNRTARPPPLAPTPRLVSPPHINPAALQ